MLDEKGMSKVIRAELDLIAVLSQAGRYGHNTGIADEDVESLRFGSEQCTGFINRGK